VRERVCVCARVCVFSWSSLNVPPPQPDVALTGWPCRVPFGHVLLHMSRRTSNAPPCAGTGVAFERRHALLCLARVALHPPTDKQSDVPPSISCLDRNVLLLPSPLTQIQHNRHPLHSSRGDLRVEPFPPPPSAPPSTAATCALTRSDGQGKKKKTRERPPGLHIWQIN
jgi:hypothetical protein